MQPIEEQINLWAEALTKRVIEIRSFDMGEMKKAISAHIKMAIHDCMKIQISDLERKLFQKKLIYETCKGQNAKYIQKEIIELNYEIKERNVMKSQIEQIEKLSWIITWMRENHPNSLAEFYKSWEKHEKKFSNINRITATGCSTKNNEV